MRRCPKTVGGALVAVLATSATAAPALASAAQPGSPPPARSAALTDSLGTALGRLLADVLGTTGQQQLQQALGALQSGQQPSASTLASLRALLQQVAATPGLPASVKTLVERVAALLADDGSGPLAPGLLAPVAGLLHGLADTQGVPAAAATLLDDLGDALGTVQAPGLPVDALALDPAVTAAVADVQSALAGGAQVTGAVLQPLVPLLDQVAATPGLPAPLAELVSQLGDTIQSTPGALDPLTASTLASVLSSVGNTAGVPAPTKAALAGTASMIAPGGTAAANAKRAATSADKAVIVGLRLNRKHTLVRVRIVCPRQSPATCATRVSATLGGQGAAKAKRVRLGHGRHKVVRLRVVRTARASIARKGGWLRVKAVTTFSGRHFTAKRALRLAPPASARRR